MLDLKLIEDENKDLFVSHAKFNIRSSRKYWGRNKKKLIHLWFI